LPANGKKDDHRKCSTWGNVLRKEMLILFAASTFLLFSPGVGAQLKYGLGGQLLAQETPRKEGSSQTGLARSASERKIELRRAIAGSLRDEAYAIQQQGRSQDAIIKYRESLVYFPDAGLNDYISTLEKKTGKASPVIGPENPPPQSSIPATVRNRSRQSVHILPEGETANDSNFFTPGDIKSMSVSSYPQGRVTFHAVRDGKVIASTVWQRDPGDVTKVPAVLYDDAEGPPKLTVMTGIRLR
jgi:hypothetical protein